MTTSIYIDNQSRLDKKAIVDLYFQEHRAKLIDIAAFLDRIDRAPDSSDQPDFRVEALLRANSLLSDGQAQRARRILELFSDLSREVPLSAGDVKGATGVVKP